MRDKQWLLRYEVKLKDGPIERDAQMITGGRNVMHAIFNFNQKMGMDSEENGAQEWQLYEIRLLDKQDLIQ